MAIRILLILLFPILCFAQYSGWGSWSKWGGADVTAPTAPTVVLARNDADSLDVTNDFNGAADIDSIFVRKGTSYPASKTAGDSVYSGTDTTVANSLVFAHGLSAIATVYLRTFVQDSLENISYGSASLSVDEWVQTAPTATADTNSTDSIDVTLTTFDPDGDSTRIYVLNGPAPASWDSVGVADTTALDSINSWVYAHGLPSGDATQYIYIGVKDTTGNIAWDSTTVNIPTFATTDIVAPNIAGTVTITFDTTSATNVYSFNIASTVQSDSADTNLWRIEVKTHATDAYSVNFELAKVPADSTFSLTPTLSMRDSLFLRVSVDDTNSNRSAYVYDTVATTPIYLKLLSNVGLDSTTHAWVYVDKADSNAAAQDSFRIIYADMTADGDTLEVPINSPITTVGRWYWARNVFNDTLGLKGTAMWYNPLPAIATITVDTTGTDSVTIALSGYTYGSTAAADIKKTWIGMSDTSITSPDTSGYGDSTYTSLDSVNTYTWAHEKTESDSVFFYVITQNDLDSLSVVYIDTLEIPDFTAPTAGALNQVVTPIGMDSISIQEFGNNADLAAVYVDLWDGETWVNVYSAADTSTAYTIENSAVNNVPFNPDSTLRARLRLVDDWGNTTASYDTTQDDSARTVTVEADTARSVVQSIRVFMAADSNGTKTDSCYFPIGVIDTTTNAADTLAFKVYAPVDTQWYAARPKIGGTWGTIGAWYQFPLYVAPGTDYTDCSECDGLFYWNGDNAAGSLYGCEDPDTTLLGTLSGAAIVFSDTDPGESSPASGDTCLKLDASNDYLRWPITTGDIFNSAEGRITFDLYISADAYGTFYLGRQGSSNETFVTVNSNNTMIFSHEGTDSVCAVSSTDVIVDTNWTAIEVRWSVTNNQVGIKIGSGSWKVDTDVTTVTAFSSAATYLYLGYSNITAVSLYIDNVKVYNVSGL